jgi:hypothetical protein
LAKNVPELLGGYLGGYFEEKDPVKSLQRSLPYLRKWSGSEFCRVKGVKTQSVRKLINSLAHINIPLVQVDGGVGIDVGEIFRTVKRHSAESTADLKDILFFSGSPTHLEDIRCMSSTREYLWVLIPYTMSHFSRFGEIKTAVNKLVDVVVILVLDFMVFQL